MKKFVLFLAIILSITGCSSSTKTVSLDPKNPITLSLWHYYNGVQFDYLNSSIETFNRTVGKDKGIIVVGSNLGSINDLQTALLNSVNKTIDALPMPDIFMVYPDTARTIDEKSMLADLTPYFSKEERAEYVDSFLEEGDLNGTDELKIFPIAKSTEVLEVNKTDWDVFAAATNADIAKFATMEGIVELSEQYYNYTDGLTPEENDGKAFFGRDAMANYLVIGAKQLGTELFSIKDGVETLDFNKTVIRKLWDNYYVPYIKGYFNDDGKFRSDTIKTGKILSFVGSTTSASYFPKEIIVSDTESYPIEAMVLPCPVFQDGKKYIVQQGAGMAIASKDEKTTYAACEFIKWFTSLSQNVNFSVETGYLPVKKASNEDSVIDTALLNSDSSQLLKDVEKTAADMLKTYNMYVAKSFQNGIEVRNICSECLTLIGRKDKAEIDTKIEEGTSRETALKPYLTDDYFNAWYEKTKAELEKLISR